MNKTSAVIIDAGVGIFQVISNPLSEQVDKKWAQWIKEGCIVCAPQLWLNETTSALHKIYKQNLISEEEVERALESLLGLGVDLYEADAEACQMAFAWANRLDQYQAYDGFYLALAEQLQAVFWTTDRRMVNRVRQLGITWVYSIGE